MTDLPRGFTRRKGRGSWGVNNLRHDLLAPAERVEASSPDVEPARLALLAILPAALLDRGNRRLRDLAAEPERLEDVLDLGIKELHPGVDAVLLGELREDLGLE